MDKQIEEMAKDICSPCHKGKLGLWEPKEGCVVWEYAKNAIEEGYRKVCEPVIRNGEVVGFVNGADYVPKNLFLFGVANTRKETAEKFAERLRKVFEKDDDWDEYSVGTVRDYIDEICKEISEGV